MAGRRRRVRDMKFDVTSDDPMDAYEPDLEVAVPEGVELRLTHEVLGMQNRAATDAADAPERAGAIHRLWLWKAVLTLAMRIDERRS
ncbi:hypothetical protein [Microcella pacifica]|uniref:Uncharacterized protein n=1 Tax=Microcella pacifica TaxID=2591847 RepID=A0A9E5JP24_9MICO|nr:hypothetical protein [Microcella pacifica]NHF62272.1 hypothetical protein [Microcella pacifica]